MDKIINLDLLSHPANWLIIFLVLYLAALIAKMLHDAAVSGISPIPNPLVS